jgi:AcrR family transcriptional regulator
MARPFTASDDEILGAARNVLATHGPDAFSVAAVASKVGLSRAAIILRFKSTHALKVALLGEMVQQFAAALDTLPQTPSGDNLLRLAAFIGSHTHSRESSMRFFANYYSSNVRNRELLELERARGEALDRAISKVMPVSALQRSSAVLAFRAHLSGSIMAWLGLDDVDARGYLVSRTREWLKLAGLTCSEHVVKELSASAKTVAGAARSRSASAKVSRARKGAARR